MGTLDFLKEFENRALDGVTYSLLERSFQLQEDNNRMLREKVDSLVEENSSLKVKNDALQVELDLKNQLLASSQFTIKEGIAFRRSGDGPYEETPYCANCKAVMENPKPHHFRCPRCNHQTKVGEKLGDIAQSLNP